MGRPNIHACTFRFNVRSQILALFAATQFTAATPGIVRLPRFACRGNEATHVLSRRPGHLTAKSSHKQHAALLEASTLLLANDSIDRHDSQASSRSAGVADVAAAKLLVQARQVATGGRWRRVVASRSVSSVLKDMFCHGVMRRSRRKKAPAMQQLLAHFFSSRSREIIAWERRAND
eukprot:6195389-Pleurochrysis_carterae.AAC.1